MAIYIDPDEPEFARLEARHRWFEGVLLAECGELKNAPTDAEPPDALNWLLLVPPDRRFDFDEVECGMAFVAQDGSGYECTFWDATGVEDEPWAVFIVDDLGPRLLPEYSLFDEEATNEAADALLGRAADEAPERAERGEWARTGTPLTIPDWLYDLETKDDDGFN